MEDTPVLTITDKHAAGAHGAGEEICNLCVQENLLRMAHHA